MWKIHEFYWAINDLQGHPSQQDWKDHLKPVQSWVAATPNSITARVVLAPAYIDYAWDARGGETGDTVTNSGWKLFGQRLEQAKATLDEASALPSQCPELYGVSVANLNRLALMATKSKDSVVADGAFKRIGDSWDKQAWTSEVYFNQKQDMGHSNRSRRSPLPRDSSRSRC